MQLDVLSVVIFCILFADFSQNLFCLSLEGDFVFFMTSLTLWHSIRPLSFFVAWVVRFLRPQRPFYAPFVYH